MTDTEKEFRKYNNSAARLGRAEGHFLAEVLHGHVLGQKEGCNRASVELYDCKGEYFITEMTTI
uniref:Uncharacterized protein n=1 Tax=Parascaris univalens TaxID=6257 RepID=A0A915AFI7_PARUN